MGGVGLTYKSRSTTSYLEEVYADRERGRDRWREGTRAEQWCK